MNELNSRWMVHADLPQVLRIERECFGELAWTEDDFHLARRDNMTIGIVVEDSSGILGYMVYRISRREIEVVNIAVDERVQGRGIGSAMLLLLANKLSHGGRNTVKALVSERNDTAHAFFRSNGYRAKLVRSPYDNDECDGYLFSVQYCDLVLAQAAAEMAAVG